MVWKATPLFASFSFLDTLAHKIEQLMPSNYVTSAKFRGYEIIS